MLYFFKLDSSALIIPPQKLRRQNIAYKLPLALPCNLTNITTLVKYWTLTLVSVSNIDTQLCAVGNVKYKLYLSFISSEFDVLKSEGAVSET